MRAAARRAIFLDRDGTINVRAEAGRYIREADELVLLPGAAAAVRAINDSDALAVVVSNQRWLSAPGVSPAAFERLDARLRELLASADGAYLDGCYVCPHELASCDCRKPAPGMLLRAAEDLGVELSASVIIGDSPSDIAAGRAVGARCALLSDWAPPRGAHATADRVFPTLREAVEWAL